MSIESKKHFLAQYGNQEHIENALKSKDGEVRYCVSKNPLLPVHHMEAMVKDKNAWGDHLGLSENPSAPPHILHKLAQHKDPEVQSNAAIHKNADPNSIDLLLNNRYTMPSVTNSIVEKSPHVTKKQLEDIKNSPDSYHEYTRDMASKRLDKKDYAEE